MAAIAAKQNDLALEAAHNRERQAAQDYTNKKTTSAAGIAIQKAADKWLVTLAGVAASSSLSAIEEEARQVAECVDLRQTRRRRNGLRRRRPPSVRRRPPP